MGGRTWLARWAVLLLLSAPAAARAQGEATENPEPHDSPIALAEALFRSGRELMTAGRYTEACPKFAESERVDPKPGTLLNLALCHERTGRTASAWAEYVDAAEIAHAAGESEREKVALAHAATLEPRLAHIFIQPPADDDQVSLDERVLGAGAFGTPIPVDPGDHVLRATATGKKPFATSFAVTPGQATRTFRIPSLEDDRSPAAGLPAAAPVVPAAALRPSSWVARVDGRTWGFVAGGAGLALLGVGAFFGVEAFVDKHTANRECDAAQCTQTGLNAIAAMKAAEATSTLTILGGVAGVGAGLYLILASPRRSDGSSWRVGPDVAMRGIRVRADW